MLFEIEELLITGLAQYFKRLSRNVEIVRKFMFFGVDFIVSSEKQAYLLGVECFPLDVIGNDGGMGNV